MRSIHHILLFLIGISLFSAPAKSEDDPVILVIGDSLSAGFGMQLSESWPRLLQKRLDDNGHQYRVVNSSITGDTTQGGLTRLPGLLDKHRPVVVIIEQGGNDGLRGISIPVTHGNLSSMVSQSQDIGAKVMLTGIRLPPNYGPNYTQQFYAIYGDLEMQYGLILIPFFMEGVAFDPGLMQGDGIHPNARAQPILMNKVWFLLEPNLD